MPEAPEENSSPLKQIRTFQGDVADALHTQKESLYSIHTAEKLKAASGGSVADLSVGTDAEKREKFFLFLLGSFLFLGLAVAFGWYSYQEYIKKITPPVVTTPQGRFISAEKSVELDITGLSRDALLAAISAETEGLDQTELKHIAVNASSSVFFKTLETQAPSSLVRALEPTFMLGSLGKERFLIFKISSFENTFAGMLNWEKDMASDLGPLFSTGPLMKSIGPQSVFKDVIYRNKDARVFTVEKPIGDANSTSTPVATAIRTVMLYSFLDNQMLIITESLETLEILIGRLTREKLSR